LKAGQDVEFEFDPDKEEDVYDWEDESEKNKIDYKKLFEHRNTDVVLGDEDDEGEEDDKQGEEGSERKTKPTSAQTPFEMLRARMEDVSPTKDGGVLKRVIIPGSGLVVPKASRVRVHYNAYFEMNDEPFDSTHLRNKSFEFKLGAGEVVYGLDVGVATMKRYEKAQFIFEPEYYIGKFGCIIFSSKTKSNLFSFNFLKI
jgi:FKBP-type peptidyl-prolyl cis-trans isomerase